MYSPVLLQFTRIVKCSIRALFASMLARHAIVHCAFVRLHVVLLCELLVASINIAREWLVECVRDAVLVENCFLIESLVANITSERSSIVHSLVLG